MNAEPDAEPGEPQPAAAAARAVVERLRGRQARAAAAPPVPLPLLDPDLARWTADANADHFRLGWAASVPGRFVHARLADLDPGAERDHLTAWASRDGDVPNLLLLGEVGVGKSHAAVAACRPAYERGLDVLFVPIGEMLDRLDWRRPDSAAYLELLCTVDVLIVDDVGSERANEWTGERLYLVINRRWLDGLRTVATSNLEPAELARPRDEGGLGARTYSRLAGGALAVRLAGPDRRRTPMEGGTTGV